LWPEVAKRTNLAGGLHCSAFANNRFYEMAFAWENDPRSKNHLKPALHTEDTVQTSRVATALSSASKNSLMPTQKPMGWRLSNSNG
jgi:hypothetical protein